MAPELTYTLIGDIVASRKADDREALQRLLRTVLSEANSDPRLRFAGERKLEVTLGDEFQGLFADADSAIRTTLVVRLELLIRAGVDLRFGVGAGPIDVYDEARSPVSQDGPGWWAARRAIDRAKSIAAVPRTSTLRTCYSEWTEAGQAPSLAENAINAFLASRDHMVTRMKPRDLRLLGGLIRGRSQEEMAAEEKITQSAVSQRLNASGAYVIDAAQRRLKGDLK
jgi:hypothetical protein